MPDRSTHTRPTLPVFPGAQGFGVDTPAGRNGRVLRVTSLDAEGPGTLRAAIETPGPRVIVFEVGGVIDLQGKSLTIEEPYVTIAGQTAPPVGITLIRGSLLIATHDILIQHLRVRPGDMNLPKKCGWEPDGISTTRPASGPTEVHHIVIDHCTLTWAVDENLSISGERHAGREGTGHCATLSNCLIAEALDDSTHPKGAHSKGTLIHDHVRDVAVVRNLYACNADRNPVLKPDASAVVVNNLIYNPRQAPMRTLWTAHEYVDHPGTLLPSELTAIGNMIWPGPDTPAGLETFRFVDGHCRVYLRDNRVRLKGGDSEATVAEPAPTWVAEPTLWPDSDLALLDTCETAEHILAQAGAWPASRDAIDQRIIDGVHDGTARIIDSQEEVGGYPRVAPVRHELAVPDDPHATDETTGYSRIETWLHELSARAEGRARA